MDFSFVGGLVDVAEASLNPQLLSDTSKRSRDDVDEQSKKKLRTEGVPAEASVEGSFQQCASALAAVSEQFEGLSAQIVVPKLQSGITTDMLRRIAACSHDANEALLNARRLVESVYRQQCSSLSSAASSPALYLRIVATVIGREATDPAGIERDLLGVMGGNRGTTMEICHLLATTTGATLAPEVIDAVKNVCAAGGALHVQRREVETAVADHVAAAAPNLVEIVGRLVAVQLMAEAGGLQGLAKCTSTQLKFLGKEKAMGMLNTQTVHGGFIAEAPMLIDVAEMYRNKALQFIADKAALAVRIDAAGECRDGSKGKELAALIQKKVEALEAPAAARLDKPLPIPKKHEKKQRGGEKVRRMREARGVVTAAHVKAHRVVMTANMTDDRDEGEQLAAMSRGMARYGGGQLAKEADDADVKAAEAAAAARDKKRILNPDAAL